MEELEDRLGSSLDEILDLVKASLVPTESSATTPNLQSYATANSQIDPGAWQADEAMHEEEYQDYGEGAGVEGDLDVEEE